jgi:PmbA protein
MLTPQNAADRASDLVERARKAGADTADAVYSASASNGIQVRLGKLEDVERSEGERLSLRVFVGQQSASIGSSDLSGQALDELAARAVDMARAAPEDSYAGLAPAELLCDGDAGRLDLLDGAEPDAQALRALAEEVEDAARAVPGVTNSEGGSAGFERSVFALATSHGFASGYSATNHSISAVVLGGEGADKQRDYAWRQARHAADLPSAQQIGSLAGERAVAKVGSRKLKGGAMPVIFGTRVSSSLIGHLLGAMSGASIARRASFLLDKLGEPVFSASLTLEEDPHRPRGLRSRMFDGEGLATSRRNLVEDGRVTTWLLNAASARQLGVPPTGHAARGGGGAPGVSTGNIAMAAGLLSPADLIGEVENGVYITELFGQGVNGVTGDYSRGAAGFRIANGELAEPVSEFTVAGNLLAMLANMTAANDLEWFRPITVPTLRIDGMTVAGD